MARAPPPSPCPSPAPRVPVSPSSQRTPGCRPPPGSLRSIIPQGWRLFPQVSVLIPCPPLPAEMGAPSPSRLRCSGDLGSGAGGAER